MEDEDPIPVLGAIVMQHILVLEKKKSSSIHLWLGQFSYMIVKFGVAKFLDKPRGKSNKSLSISYFVLLKKKTHPI